MSVLRKKTESGWKSDTSENNIFSEYQAKAMNKKVLHFKY